MKWKRTIDLEKNVQNDTVSAWVKFIVNFLVMERIVRKEDLQTFLEDWYSRDK